MERTTKPRQRNQVRQCKRLSIVKQLLAIFIKFSLIAILVIILNSCSMFMSADKEYLLKVEKGTKTMVEEGKKSMVILRIALEIDGEPHEPFHGFGIIILLGGFKTGGKLKYILRDIPHNYNPPNDSMHYCLSSETCKQGWTVFFLDPGIHYFSFVYPTFQPDSYENLKKPPIWRIDIPTDVKSVYIGTLNIRGVGFVKGWMLDNPSKVKFFEINVIDEKDSADRIMNEIYPKLGTPQSLIMRKHEGPIYIRTPYQKKDQ
jgi:hypothetical protein